MKKAGIYTGTGDCGSTSLGDGTRVAKDHPRVQAYGTLDELNAHLGLLAASIGDSNTIAFIEEIENCIFTIGCHLATGNNSTSPICGNDTAKLEKEIDTISASLPPLKSFILPPGCEQAARANVCRTICRRAERVMTTLCREAHISPEAMVYVNRLSDYLFVLQRQLLQGKEKMWQKPCE
ncbi:MAG: cob(I)yrinic acid a,c-diamide adenosyltransferase [Bacteroidaceae bacterium]|nr:cob(I)yrinic acid a,c-diamide adenosyltransferase [Bacteroidaceae bacterium]